MADAETAGLSRRVEVVVVTRRRGHRAYACGGNRGEVIGSSGRWRWRVWAVVGPVPLAAGRCDYVNAAEIAVVHQLAARKDNAAFSLYGAELTRTP